MLEFIVGFVLGFWVACNQSFCVCVKRYGYESLSNNGFEYSDMGDYEIDFAAEERLTPEMEEFCVEYIKQVDAELYETVKKLWKK